VQRLHFLRLEHMVGELILFGHRWHGLCLMSICGRASLRYAESGLADTSAVLVSERWWS
jgi:hypothetical protein